MVKVNLNTQVFIGFLLAIFLVLVLSYIAFTNQKHSQAATTLVARSTKALYYAREAFSVALDVDMSQRAYVLTGDTSFVQPYRYAVETIPRHISDLRKLAKGQPAQLTRLATFESLVDQRLALARETINAHDKAHVQSAPRVNTSLRGTMIMDEIRQIFLGFQAEEKGLLKTRSVRQAALLDSYNKSLNALYAAVAVVLVTLLLLIYKNLQARSKAERLLQKRSEEIKDLYNNAPCGYQSLNANGVIVEMNDTLLRWLGYEHKQVVNVLKFRDLLTESGRLVFQKNFTLFKVQGFLTDQQFDLMRKDGGFIPVLVNSVAIFDDQGNYTKSRSSLFDIRQIKLMEAQLNEARQNAETANITKSQFLANMSHEIRTPLNAVIGLSHLALKTQLSAKQFDYLKKIQSSSESLLGIVNDILDFSKIESGKMTLEEGKFDLEEVFQKLADVITYKAQAKGLEIAFGIDSRVPTNLIGDAVRLEHVLSNLCSNAVKFTDKGEVVVNVRLLEDAGDDLKVQFKVKDTGIGMDKVQMSKLFEPFSQADETISRKYGGTGLGLSIIKRLVELMNGEVSVKSEPGKGSSFYFSVWLKRQKDQRKFPVPSVDLRKLSVLLVDDNKSALQILKRALQSFSFKVITISSGIQAVHFLKNNRHTDPVQLVLMDWKMPGMDGLEAAEIIRQDPELADVRIIMMCNSYGHENLYQKVEDLGLAGVVTKPIRYSLLYDAIMSAIEGGVVNQHEKERRETGASVKHHLRSAKLLLVEDNDINQQVATELLQGMGFVVEIANNGLEAVNMVRNSGVPSRYDLVLMDLQMPVMGGLMATSEIRKIPAYENLPIIAMTADAMVGVQEKCLEAGMLDFISKPINPDMMFETIEKWIVTKPNPGTADLPAIQKAEDVEIPIHDMEGVDIEDGLRHVAGNRKLYLELLTKFFRSNEHFAAIVKNKWLAGSADESLRMMHTLKGLSGNLGMLNLHEACKRSEKALGADGVDDVHAVLGPVEEQLNIVIRSLKTNLVKAETPVHEIELGKVLPMVDQLEKLLRDNDPEAVNVLKQIGRVNGYEKEFQEVSTLLQDYDFEKALEFLKIIKVNLK